MGEFTEIMQAIEAGDPQASDQLLPLVYDELRKLAGVYLEQEQPGQTLQATALVHEAYLRLTDGEEPASWNSRGHFFAAAAIAIRRILIENARRKRRSKHGGDLVKQSLASDLPVVHANFQEDLLDLHAALEKFAGVHPEAAQVVDLVYFCGLTLPQTAEVMAISPRTVSRHWEYARTWLLREMQG